MYNVHLLTVVPTASQIKIDALLKNASYSIDTLTMYIS